MDILLTKHQATKISVNLIEPALAREIYLSLSEPPEWLNFSKSPDEENWQNRIFFAARINDEYERWHQPDKYRNEKIFPNISIEATKMLLSRDIVGIGIDTLSPDAFGSDFPVHQCILGAGKYIIENVANAKQLDPVGSYIFALPIKVKEGTEAPMRLIGMKRKRI